MTRRKKDWSAFHIIPFFHTVINKIQKIHPYKLDVAKERETFLSWIKVNDASSDAHSAGLSPSLASGSQDALSPEGRGIRGSSLREYTRPLFLRRREVGGGTDELLPRGQRNRRKSSPILELPVHPAAPPVLPLDAPATSLPTARGVNFYHSGPRSL